VTENRVTKPIAGTSDSTSSRAAKRAYIWLISHNLCLCGMERVTRPVTRGWLSYYCGKLDGWLWPSEEER
jgi:hypothetical protein